MASARKAMKLQNTDRANIKSRQVPDHTQKLLKMNFKISNIFQRRDVSKSPGRPASSRSPE